jgi:hypothetical protein
MFTSEKPWHQQPGESDDAYNAFCLYLNMGSERSLKKLIKIVDKWPSSVEQVASWSDAFTWAKRVELCERYIRDELTNSNADLSDDRARQQKTELPMSTPQIGKKSLVNHFNTKQGTKYPTQ